MRRIQRTARSRTRRATSAPDASTTASIFGSPGRVSLIANATLFGGLVGYSIQRGSGSTDPRLLVPLMVVGG